MCLLPGNFNLKAVLYHRAQYNKRVIGYEPCTRGDKVGITSHLAVVVHYTKTYFINYYSNNDQKSHLIVGSHVYSGKSLLVHCTFLRHYLKVIQVGRIF